MMTTPKAPIRIQPILAHETPTIDVPCLRCDAFNLSEWRCKLKAVVQMCNCLVESSSNVFWSSVCLRPQILAELESALRRFPFFVDLQPGGFFHRMELESLLCDAYLKFFLVFLRMFGSFEREGVTREVFRESVLNQKILTLRRLVLFCGFFAPNYGACVRKVVGRLRQIVPELFEVTAESNRVLLKIIDSMHQTAAFMNAKSNGGERRNLEEIHEVVNRIHEWRREIVSWSELFRLLGDCRPSNELLSAIPEVMEDLSQSLDDRVVSNLSVGSEALMHGLTRAVNHLKQGLTRMYLRFYENYTDEHDKIGLMHGLIESPELMVRMAIQLREQLSGLLEKSKDKQVTSAIRRAMDHAYAQKFGKVMGRLHDQGLLEHLGEFNDTIAQDIKGLADLLPYSKEFFHLALRHFGYDHEQTLRQLLDSSTLPFELRILLHDTKLIRAASPSTRGTVAMDDLCAADDSDVEEETGETAADALIDPNDLAALFTSAPSGSARTATSAPKLSAKELKQKRTEERLRRLVERSGDALEIGELQMLVERVNRPKPSEEVVNVDGKKFAKLYKNNPDDEVAEADRAVLRKKLDELHFEDDDLGSDDEYKKMKLEEKFRVEVGQSGRFNRPQPKGPVDDDYDDECDDTYEQPLLNLAEGASVDEAKESRQTTKILGPLGLNSNHSHPASRASSSMNSRPPSTAASSSNARPKPQNSSDQRARPTQQPGPPKQKPNPAANPRPEQKPKVEVKTENERKPTAASTRQQTGSSGYTGGRARMNKERHKGQNKQRGADRKLQRANPL